MLVLRLHSSPAMEDIISNYGEITVHFICLNVFLARLQPRLLDLHISSEMTIKKLFITLNIF